MKAAEVQRLYELFAHRVYLRCLRLLGDDGDAMEQVQETWLALMHRPFPFLSDAAALAWLLKVATNKTFNEFRRRSYRQHGPLEDWLEAGALDPFPEMETEMVFRKLLDQVPPDKSSVLIGYFLEGRTIAEVAAETGWSEPTVRRIIHRFLARGKTVREGGQRP